MKTAARIIAAIMVVMSLFTYTLSEANGVLAEELREQRELDEAIAGIQEAWEGTGYRGNWQERAVRSVK